MKYITVEFTWDEEMKELHIVGKGLTYADIENEKDVGEAITEYLEKEIEW